MAALITLCNLALSGIAAGQISGFSEPTIEAREATRHAQPLLDEMAEWSADFAFGQARAVLASAANDRPAEWLYAFAQPSDLGTAKAIRMPEDAAYDLPIGGPYTLPLQDMQPLVFLVDGTQIYANVETPTLIYTRNTIAASDLSPLGQKAFVDELSARLAVPVKKLAEDKVKALLQRAAVSRARWVAHEENKVQRQATRYVSEAEYARAGYGV